MDDIYRGRGLSTWNPDRPDRGQVQNQFIVINPYPDDIEMGELGDIQWQHNRLLNVRYPSAAHLDGVGIIYIHSAVTHLCGERSNKKILVFYVEVADNSFLAQAVTQVLWIEGGEFQRGANNVII